MDGRFFTCCPCTGMKCPNCYGEVPGNGVVTHDGEIVCDDLCREGWRNGAEQLRYLALARLWNQLATSCPSQGSPRPHTPS